MVAWLEREQILACRNCCGWLRTGFVATFKPRASVCKKSILSRSAWPNYSPQIAAQRSKAIRFYDFSHAAAKPVSCRAPPIPPTRRQSKKLLRVREDLQNLVFFTHKKGRNRLTAAAPTRGKGIVPKASSANSHCCRAHRPEPKNQRSAGFADANPSLQSADENRLAAIEECNDIRWKNNCRSTAVRFSNPAQTPPNQRAANAPLIGWFARLPRSPANGRGDRRGRFHRLANLRS